MLRGGGPRDEIEALTQLEASGDPRAGYLRGQLALRRLGDDPDARRPLLRELRSLYPAEHACWLRRLEQAGAIEDNLTGLPASWWGQDLPGRPRHGTYTRYAASDLPELPFGELDASFRWLLATPVAPGSPAGACAPEPWARLLSCLHERGFTIPPALHTLMTTQTLQSAIPSATANYFMSADPDDEAVHADRLQDIEPGVAFLPFYSDQQSCVRWGVWLARDGEPYAPIISAGLEWSDGDDDSPSARYVDFDFAAPTLESFVYRTWIENRIWFATRPPETSRELLDFEAAYLVRYAGD